MSYYPKQMNGPVIQALSSAVENEFTEAITIQNYLKNVSIDSAEETELESIGCIIGFPRPIVPEGFSTENLLILGTEPIEQDLLTGLASVEGMMGGELTSLDAMSGLSANNYMSLPTYRKFLKRIAYVKRYGITLKSIDDIASLFEVPYTITYRDNDHKDILLTYSEYIGYKNVWILTQLFGRFCTEPTVIIQSGGN